MIDKVYFGSLFIVAIFTALSMLAGFMQYRLNAGKSAEKERQLAEYQLATRLQIEQAEQKAAEANERAEILKPKNLELEVTIAPRLLEQGQSGFILSKFPETRYFIETSMDVEAQKFCLADSDNA